MAFVTPLACDFCFTGIPGILSVIIAAVILIGSIYMLLWSNLGARQAYLVVMVSLAGWMMILSAIWLFGAPGTTTSTGPRGREAAWVPFLPDSEQAGDFAEAIAAFPSGWDKIGEDGKEYPGKINSRGEFENVRTAVAEAFERLAKGEPERKIKAQEASEWKFVADDIGPQTPDEEKLPVATVRYYQKDGPLLFGAVIPATDKHREFTVFAFRDKGLVYFQALLFLLISIGVFAIHLVLLGRFETKQKAREAELVPDPALV